MTVVVFMPTDLKNSQGLHPNRPPRQVLTYPATLVGQINGGFVTALLCFYSKYSSIEYSLQLRII
jgi:hypothetical protein